MHSYTIHPNTIWLEFIIKFNSFPFDGSFRYLDEKKKKNSSKEEMRDIENCADGDICKRHPTNDNSPIHIWLHAGRRYRRGRAPLHSLCIFFFSLFTVA